MVVVLPASAARTSHPCHARFSTHRHCAEPERAIAASGRGDRAPVTTAPEGTDDHRVHHRQNARQPAYDFDGHLVVAQQSPSGPAPGWSSGGIAWNRWGADCRAQVDGVSAVQKSSVVLPRRQPLRRHGSAGSPHRFRATRVLNDHPEAVGGEHRLSAGPARIRGRALRTALGSATAPPGWMPATTPS